VRPHGMPGTQKRRISRLLLDGAKNIDKKSGRISSMSDVKDEYGGGLFK
jgi:hypothetical protein